MPNDIAPADTADNAEAVSVTEKSTDAGDWRASLSEDIRENPSFSKFKDVNGLAASYVNLQSHLGRDKIAKPVTDSDWDDVYEFLGRPESADKYEVALPDGLPDEVAAQFTEQRLSAFKQEAHRLGLNTNQVKSLVAWQAGNVSEQHEMYKGAIDQSIEQGEIALKAEWGRAYNQNVKFAHQAFVKYGGEQLAAKMEASGLGNDPDVLKAFANIAKTTMADKDLAGPFSGSQMALTPEEARAEASTIMSHPAYTDKRHPEHNAMVKKVQALFNQAYAE